MRPFFCDKMRYVLVFDLLLCRVGIVPFRHRGIDRFLPVVFEAIIEASVRDH